MTGATGAWYVNLAAALTALVPTGVITVISTVPTAPDGLVAVR
jgi:hypothetical protein